jgi:hypothetical protein
MTAAAVVLVAVLSFVIGRLTAAYTIRRLRAERDITRDMAHGGWRRIDTPHPLNDRRKRRP